MGLTTTLATVLRFLFAWFAIYAVIRAGRRYYSDKDEEEYEEGLSNLDKLVIVGESFALASIIMFGLFS